MRRVKEDGEFAWEDDMEFLLVTRSPSLHCSVRRIESPSMIER